MLWHVITCLQYWLSHLSVSISCSLHYWDTSFPAQISARVWTLSLGATSRIKCHFMSYQHLKLKSIIINFVGWVNGWGPKNCRVTERPIFSWFVDAGNVWSTSPLVNFCQYFCLMMLHRTFTGLACDHRLSWHELNVHNCARRALDMK
jgi:hypothetical protein